MHFVSLTKMPVFADEAIYIRWAQLIMDDWQRYAFFALNDGKTPLFIWSLIPFQYLFSDQLFAARCVSVLVGAVGLFIVKKIIAVLGGREKTQILAMVFAAVLPFWFFHAHLALMDGMLLTAISAIILGTLHLEKAGKKDRLFWRLFTGASIGVSLWTKLPGLIILPALPFFAFVDRKKLMTKLPFFFSLAAAGLIGLVIFAALRVSPAFGQLFHRGSDFTYPVSEVFLRGKWKETIANTPSYFSYFLTYLTAPILIFTMAGLFLAQTRRKNAVLLLSACLFCFPLILFGKVVYARYFLPASLFFTVAAALSVQAIYDRWIAEQSKTDMTKRGVIGIIVALLIANAIAGSLVFDSYVLLQPDQTPFVRSDRAQYLEDWSSGHGILQTVTYIQQQAQNHTIAVATEGRFGSLPDGLLLYFHNRDVKNIYIEGTGEYPVKDLPAFFVDKAKNFDQSILVVNSNRMEIKLPQDKLLHEYCRPNNAPCLQIWDITSLVKPPQQASSLPSAPTVAHR
jgi:4-amino-4-deoxy-L-arabinose transferase-like glycosyltransferase